jgi:hypothetical protein
VEQQDTSLGIAATAPPWMLDRRRHLMTEGRGSGPAVRSYVGDWDWIWTIPVRLGHDDRWVLHQRCGVDPGA